MLTVVVKCSIPDYLGVLNAFLKHLFDVANHDHMCLIMICSLPKKNQSWQNKNIFLFINSKCVLSGDKVILRCQVNKGGGWCWVTSKWVDRVCCNIQ